jgi:hypothetical protein
MQHLGEHVTGVLDGCVVHFDFDVDGTAIDVVRIGISICGSYSNHALFPFALMLIDDQFKTFKLSLQIAAQLLERRWC